jgi:hypothetical protein
VIEIGKYKLGKGGRGKVKRGKKGKKTFFA